MVDSFSIRYLLINKPHNLEDNILLIEKVDNEENFCTISIINVSDDVTGIEGYNYFIDIKTRNSRQLVADIAYICCTNYDSLIFNDSGLLGKQEILRKKDLVNFISADLRM